MEKSFTLNNSTIIPACGLGTYNLTNPEVTVYDSIKAGIRSIDTALYYNNEKEVGLGIKKALDEKIVKREELYVITKLWPTYYNKAEETLKSQLSNLQLDYVDLYLVHWPMPAFNKETNKFENISMIKLWSEFESFVQNGYTKSIGVSNFNVQSLLELINNCNILPAVNEVEFHPYLHQEDLNSFCKLYNIRLIAYNSLVNGSYAKKKDFFNDYQIFEEETVLKLSEKYNKSRGQIILNWAVNHGVIVIPKSNSIERMKENLESLSFVITKDDMVLLDKLNKNKRFNFGIYDWSGYVNIFA